MTEESSSAFDERGLGEAQPSSNDWLGRVRAAFERAPDPEPTASGLRGWLEKHIERWSRNISRVHILKLVTERKRLMGTLREIPKRMQRVTNQARLVLELIDDFANGVYNDIPWHALAIAAATLLYSVSPADVVPDAIPALGALDDMAVMAVGMALVRKHLQRYCEFKGYDPSEYF